MKSRIAALVRRACSQKSLNLLPSNVSIVQPDIELTLNRKTLKTITPEDVPIGAVRVPRD